MTRWTCAAVVLSFGVVACDDPAESPDSGGSVSSVEDGGNDPGDGSTSSAIDAGTDSSVAEGGVADAAEGDATLVEAGSEDTEYGYLDFGDERLVPERVNCLWSDAEQRFNMSVFFESFADGMAVIWGDWLTDVVYPLTTEEDLDDLLAQGYIGWAGLRSMRVDGVRYELVTDQGDPAVWAEEDPARTGWAWIRVGGDFRHPDTGEVKNLLGELYCETSLR